jgi:hypothetical protein
VDLDGLNDVLRSELRSGDLTFRECFLRGPMEVVDGTHTNSLRGPYRDEFVERIEILYYHFERHAYEKLKLMLTTNRSSCLRPTYSVTL